MNLSFCDEDPLVIRGREIAAARPQANIDFTIGYVVFGFLFNFCCLAVWLWYSSRYERLRVRPTLFVVLAVLSSLCQMSYGSFMSIFSQTYPCFLGPLLLISSIPFCATSVIGRLVLYGFLSRYSSEVSRKLRDRPNQQQQQQQEEDGNGNKQLKQYASSSSPQEGGSESGSWSRIGSVRRAVHSTWLVVKRIMHPTGSVNSDSELAVLKFLTTTKGILCMVCVFSLPVFVIILTVMFSSQSANTYAYCTTCAISTQVSSFTVALIVLFWFKGVIDWVLISRRDRAEQEVVVDVWGLKSEMFANLLAVMVIILGFVLATFDWSRIYPYSHLFMLSAGVWLLVGVQSLLQLYLARRAENKLLHANANSASQGKIDAALLDLVVLQDAELGAKFEKHLIGEFAVESLYFLKDVKQWEDAYHTVSTTARLARARKIYKNYISLAGLYSVNVSGEVNQQIRVAVQEHHRAGGGAMGSQRNLHEEKKDVPADLFHAARVEIAAMLIAGALARFYHEHMANASPVVGKTQPARSLLSTAVVSVDGGDVDSPAATRMV